MPGKTPAKPKCCRCMRRRIRLAERVPRLSPPQGRAYQLNTCRADGFGFPFRGRLPSSDSQKPTMTIPSLGFLYRSHHHFTRDAIQPRRVGLTTDTSIRLMDSEALVLLLRSLTRGAFVARHHGLYMVISEGDSKSPITFHTAAVSITDKQKLEQMMAKPDKKPEYEVMAVSKAPGHPYPDRISVGRARNCDLVLRDPSVSKLHAHFKLREHNKHDLVDLDSQNGTCINGVQLTPNKPEPVWPGDTVQFGNVTAWLLDAGALFDLMK